MAMQFFATTPRQRFLIGATPLLGFASIALSAVVRGDPVETALKLFTAGALGAALARVIFTPYVRRQVARRRSGLPFEQLSGPKAAFFLVVLTAATLGVAAALSVLE